MNARTAFLLFILFLPFCLAGQDFPEPMRPARAVNDFADMLSEDEQARLEQKLRNFNDTTSSALVIVTVNSLQGMDISRYATELAHKWGVGREDVDNGLVILVAREERQVNISTGYGLEGAVPDALAKRIIEQQIEPRFRQGNFYGGLDAATDTIMKLASGEYSPEDVGQEEAEGFPWFAVLIVLFLIIFPILQRRRFKNRHIGSSRRSVGWLPMLMLMNGMNRHRGSSYQDFNRGGGTFGGGGGAGGGGFGGFGGGGFGGGGASGSW